MLRRQRNKVVGEKKGKESEVGDVSVKQMEKEKENKMVSGGRRKGKRIRWQQVGREGGEVGRETANRGSFVF